MSATANETNDEDPRHGEKGPTQDAKYLSFKLLTPSTILSLTMFGLTFLPMASCGSDREIVPAVMVVELTQENANGLEGWLAYPKGLMGAIPITFMFTVPYWTAFPILLVLPLMWKSPRWATRFWRLFVLALALASSSFALMDQIDWRWVLFHVVCFASVGFWFWSSPLAAWVASLIFRIVRRGRKPDWRKRRPLFGGFWALALLCFAGYFYLALYDDLLYGGKLAALTNVGLAFACVISARQSRIDSNRIPQFNTRDLMVFTLAIAISMWRFWLA